MIRLAAFFGNPGSEHERTRHNAGWLLSERLAVHPDVRQVSLDWRKKFRGLWAAAALAERAEPVHFLKPLTFMNESGRSVLEAASFFKIRTEEIIVVHDELELPLGTISLKYGGGLGGHNGLRSMVACFGKPDFWRLRVGIGRPDSRIPGQGGPPGSGVGIVDWVLSPFTPEETAALSPALETAAGQLLDVLAAEPENFLPRWAKTVVS